MKNQRGITLVELLVTISIMVIVVTPIMTLVSLVLTTHNDVSESNELQHEARLMIEYMTQKVQDGASWDTDTKRLMSGTRIDMWYDEANRRVLRGEEGSYVFSEHVQSFDVQVDGQKVELHFVLVMGSSDSTYELKTTMYKREKQIDL
jgi:prepilin-type N-terminal cleavage/methylation domain-containing protein